MIPKIIHQVWEGKSIPDLFLQMSETWKKFHLQWQYEFWNGERMKAFIDNHYPFLKDIYMNYKYKIQRWDFIRYLILYKFGGMYVDFDFECLDSFDDYLTDYICYFAKEPEQHRVLSKKDMLFSNALMVTPPGHPFFKYVITHLQTTPVVYTGNKFIDVMHSTGPAMLINQYEKYGNKSEIDFFSPEQVMPWTHNDVRKYVNGTANEKILEKKLENAIAIHYFWGSWLKNDN